MALFNGRPEVDTPSLSAGAYLRLSSEQMARAMQYGTPRAYSLPTLLYRQGEREADLYIVVSGMLETFWKDAVDQHEYSITLEPGEFSGELNLLNQRETMIAARACAGSALLRLPRERLREFLTAEPLIGEVILKTIVRRRQLFVQTGTGGLVLLGHEGSGETSKLARFLAANSYPFRVLDPDHSPAAHAVLEERGVRDAALPTVLGRKWILR